MKIFLIVLAVIVVLVVIYFISAYNGFIKSKNTVDEAFSTMDVYLKKRWALIPNLVETVKGYASHEKETLEGVINLRNNAYGSMSEEEKLDTNAKISQSIPKIMALAENYPDLKANANFRDLSAQLTKIEEDIANSRKFYNAVVKQFNNKVEMFPSNIVASIFKFEKRKMYEIDDNAQRENVKVEF